jgi:hypothetical protein
MSLQPDKIYYRQREQHERAMAEKAASHLVRSLHEELAARYRGLAIAADFNPTLRVRS